MSPEQLVRALRERLPDDAVSTDAADLELYGRDWTKVYAPSPVAIVWPRTTDEVSRVMAFCNDARVAVVPSGGRTGLAAGAVARNGEVVLSVARMRRLDPVDAIGMTVRVQAGVVTEEVHRHAAAQGLTWPVDFASKGSSVVGGNIATNAGGVRVIRYGLTRQWVLGLEVVLASGDVLELNGALEKNNTGPDLRQLFIGSEGTLGVITEATLKLTRRPGAVDVFMFALDDLDGMLRLFEEARQGPFVVMAYEFFTERCLARLQRHRNVRAPFSTSPYYVLLEVEASHRDRLEPWVAQLFERGVVRDGTMAQNTSQAADLWSLREGISESLTATGMPHKNDVALPIAELRSFCAQFESVFAERYPGWEICVFGHIGDGNLHINVMKPDDLSREAFLERTHEADRDLFELVKQHRGSISAEHGIGLLKRDFLGYSRSEAEIALFRAIKRTLDPNGILNPGKILA